MLGISKDEFNPKYKVKSWIVNLFNMNSNENVNGLLISNYYIDLIVNKQGFDCIKDLIQVCNDNNGDQFFKDIGVVRKGHRLKILRNLKIATTSSKDFQGMNIVPNSRNKWKSSDKWNGDGKRGYSSYMRDISKTDRSGRCIQHNGSNGGSD